MYFQAQIFSLSFSQFLELFPFLILTLTFAISIVGSGLRLPPRFFKLLGCIGFTAPIFFWAVMMFNPSESILGLQSTSVGRVVGVLVSIFGFLSFAAFDVADRYKDDPEWLALLFLSALGLCLLPLSRDWISFFIFLETFSIPAYVLVAYDFNRERSLEASLKYLLSGAFASALLLMGIALTYLISGTVGFMGISSNFSSSGLATIAGILILAGLLFKLTAVPFHFWAADVYQGAPMGVSGFLAAGTKVSIFVSGALAFHECGFSLRNELVIAGIVVAAASALIGSFLAFSQRSFRRMLAYSGTVNAGVLVPLMVSGTSGLASGLFFLFVYGATLLVILSCFSSILKKRELDANDDLDIESFGTRDKENSSFECLVIGTCLISMAGIPPLPGFIAKYWAYYDLWQMGYYKLVSIALFSTLLGVAYYIRIAGKFFFGESKKIIHV
jgi:NADH-quinone oxidoreductase subunit N